MIRALLDLLPTRAACPYGCGWRTRYGPKLAAHVAVEHCGDPRSMERTR